jgi:hypothetical protein
MVLRSTTKKHNLVMNFKQKLYTMTYGSCMYSLHSSTFINKFWIQQLKIPSKFDFQLGTSDIYMNFFAMSLKCENLFMVFFYKFLYFLFIKVIF